MTNPVSSIRHITPVEPISTGRRQVEADFSSVLRAAIDRVETTGNSAAKTVDAFLSGEEGELHSTILATQKASLEFEMFLQVRNKVVQAYQEIMRMQL